VEGILETIPVLPLDIPADAEYAGIRAELEAAGQPIGMNDLLIAAHAYALSLTLVTDNTREFGRIRGLSVENWLER
jgi:tRNA(fMet)-specific endonuclease VapC